MKAKTETLNANTTLSSEDILHRLVLPIQTRGNIGKSTEAIGRCEWMTQLGISWKGYDLDAYNRTLSTTFPEQVSFVDLGAEPEGEIIKILRRTTQTSVTIIDPRAHLNETLLNAMQMVDLAARGAEARLRSTVLLYPIDEISDMDDLTHTVDTLGSSVDYVVVRNPVKTPRTKMFDGSELESQLSGLGAARIDLPPLLSDTRNHLRALEVQHGRGISPAEALRNPDLRIDMTHRIILEDWLRKLFGCFETVAWHLLPSPDARKLVSERKVAAPTARSAAKRGGKVNLANIE